MSELSASEPVEICKCGHPEGDHIGFYYDQWNAEQEGTPDEWSCIGNHTGPYIIGVVSVMSQCECKSWEPVEHIGGNKA